MTASDCFNYLLPSAWILVLVDCPGSQGIYTYVSPPELGLEVGDIVSVPFGAQIRGGIVVQSLTELPADLSPEQIRPVEERVVSGFFSPQFWQLLQWVADYYCTELMAVIRLALPPGLLERSQRRIRLTPQGQAQAPTGCSPKAQPLLRLLQQAKTGDYSYRYLQQQLKSLLRPGLQELLRGGWAESYLEPPQALRPKQQKIVTLVQANSSETLTAKQRDVLEILRRQGGELWLSELVQQSRCSDAVVTALATKGLVTITVRERLRLLHQPTIDRDQPRCLTADQQAALAHIQALRGYHTVLLHGVTGSGKTEVYLQAIAPILQAHQSALVLVPEIGLTPQLTDQFRARFGDCVAVYHSALSEGERYDTWRQMLLGQAQIVIGTRSAVFVPLLNLGLIILDEEHDSSFKQTQMAPTYHARRVAQYRAQLEQCPLILGSATPALETWAQRQSATSHYHYLSLPNRIQARPLPPVTLVDMREELKTGNRSIFSRPLQAALTQLPLEHQQAILFINRRGHSTFVSCRSCGAVLECPHCDVSLSYHYTHDGAAQRLRCHYCNYSQDQPQVCPQCQSSYLKFFGSGTQKVTQALTAEFPHLRWLRFDSDTTRRKGEHRRLLTAFREGQADVLVGTQMLTKGLDLAQVTLVGVIAADSLLNLADYRSAERAFQTLTQVAGRAGRGDNPGAVILQTYMPEHPVLKAVQTHDYQQFVAQELPQRQALNYPPYGRLLLLRFSGTNESQVCATAQGIADVCRQSLGPSIDILGPAPASILRVADRFRWQILLKMPSHQAWKPDLARWQSLCPSGVSLHLDIDPLSID
ncbi:primosomal protein N' [Synechocystis sp. LKSZ1]|uniref:primosomal protein N' n=1 Tax=Synechocystis sp. LKSZ1 TaxID=3144951 RepID=UPI00336BB3C0